MATAPDVQFTVDEAHRMRDEIKQVEFRKSERIFLVDPGRGDELRDPLSGEYKCDNCSSHYVAIIKLPCLLEIVDKIREKIPTGRKVRAVYGALKKPCAPRTIPDATWLQSNEEVQAFFEITMANPVRLQVILHRDPTLEEGGRDSTPKDVGEYFV